jgi:hypothetical protein
LQKAPSERSERILFEHVRPVDEQRLVERVVSIGFCIGCPRCARERRAEARTAQQPIELPT